MAEFTPDPVVGWKNKSKATGTTYLSLVLKEDLPEGTRIRLFSNTKKQAGSKAPDYFGKRDDNAKVEVKPEADNPF